MLLAMSACGGASSDGLLGGGIPSSEHEADAGNQGPRQDAAASEPPRPDATQDDAEQDGQSSPTDDATSADEGASEDAQPGAEPASPCPTPCTMLGSACCAKPGAAMYGQCYITLFAFDCN